jgi:hypothetical protein
MEVGGRGGSLEADREVELIMAFSQIIGISCDDYMDKLRVAFTHILAGKVKKAGKKNVAGG